MFEQTPLLKLSFLPTSKQKQLWGFQFCNVLSWRTTRVTVSFLRSQKLFWVSRQTCKMINESYRWVVDWWERGVPKNPSRAQDKKMTLTSTQEPPWTIVFRPSLTPMSVTLTLLFVFVRLLVVLMVRSWAKAAQHTLFLVWQILKWSPSTTL